MSTSPGLLGNCAGLYLRLPRVLLILDNSEEVAITQPMVLLFVIVAAKVFFFF